MAGSTLTLAVCVGGIYASFLLWSVLQERINTVPYGDGDVLKAPLVVNCVQSVLACLVGCGYVTAKRGRLANPFLGLGSTLLLRQLVFIAVTSSLLSPIGYALLAHVDYLAFLLAKLCKLVPVMLVHVVVYRLRFPLYKYVVAACVTVGVVVFTLSGQRKGGGHADGNVGRGALCLLALLVLDGVTNSAQDRMFATSTLDGGTLMVGLNAVLAVLTAAYTVLATNQVATTAAFVQTHPRALLDMLAFAACGALGQVFIFTTLEHFGLLVLVTVTVTRKMILMVLSVVLFGKNLARGQWAGVVLVFAGILYEAAAKRTGAKRGASKNRSAKHKQS